MKKLTSLLPVIFALVMVIALLPGCKKQRVYLLAEYHPEGYPTVTGELAFAKYVEEKTNGAIKIEVHHSHALGEENASIEMTQSGSIHFVRVGINPLMPINPQLAALGMPYLYRDRDHMFRVLDGPIGDEMMDSLIPQNLKGLCWMDSGFRNFYNSKREIKSPADIVGLKIRVQESPLMMGMVSLLGGSPTPMSLGEVYTGIQNGVVDGAENNWPSYISTAHYEVAKYFSTSQHMAAPEMILVNTSLWNSLTDDEKAIIKAGALEGARVEREEWLKAEQKYEADARAAGNIITDLTPEQLELFAEKLAPIYDQPAYAGYKDLIQRIKDTP